MAFVVVQHLSPDFKSLMDELLSRHSEMPVKLAADGEELRPNHIFLLPPGKQLHVEGFKLWLRDKPNQAPSLPIDSFFKSLAADVGELSVAIVLSGSGSDGTRGVVDIKRAGGLVLAESAATARFDSMPTSAFATGVVDKVCAPEEMPQFLCGLRAAPHASANADVEHADLDEPDATSRADLFDLLHETYGIDFSRYKSNTVTRRLERRLALRGIANLADYVAELQNDAKELNQLYQDLLIGVTRFFRDPEAFQVLEERVIPELLDRVPRSEEIRVWVAGCATGEEAYSIAILLHEQLQRAKRPPNVKLLATDMHQVSLELASAGVYAEEQLAHVSNERLERYFTRRGNAFQISSEIRQLVLFASHNVMKDAPFTRMNLIACRNLLIYLDADAQRAVLSLFHFGLSTGGVLFLGGSETTGALSHEFAVVDERSKLFRKRRDVRLVKEMSLPLGRTGAGSRKNGNNDIARTPSVEPQLLATYDRLLDKFLPPSFLIDEQGRLLDSFAGAERFLKVKRRRPTSNLLDMVDSSVRTILSTAIQRAVAGNENPRLSGIRLPNSEESHIVGVELVPGARADTSHVLVRIESDKPAQPTSDAAPPSKPLALDEASKQRVESLEGELLYAREVLQATVEELETSNEELQATNEELVASNEELQSTNEELHSVNEELYTVNAEYQLKIEELQQLNTDIQHLLEGTDVGTLFLDRELRIRKFTARIASVFRVRREDVGREIRDFSHSIRRPTLVAEVERTLREGTTVEDEVRDEDGTPFFLRILPYYSANPNQRENGEPVRDRITGVVLTITDLSALARARAHLAELSAIVQSSDDAIVGKDLNGVVKTWNRGAERLYGYSAEEAIGRDIRFLCAPGREPEVDVFLSAIRNGKKVDHVQTERIRKDGTRIHVSITISPILDQAGKVTGASAIARDVTPLIRAEQELRERREHIELLLASTAEAIYGVDVDGRCTFCNPACARMVGYSSGDLIGKQLHGLIHHTRENGVPLPAEECAIERTHREGRAAHSTDDYFYRADGSSFPVEYWSHPAVRDGRVMGAVVTFIDITERKRTLQELEGASRRREQFLAMLSHELRNPLAALLNATNVVRMNGADRPNLQKALNVLDRQGKHMARLLDDLLDISRIANGKFELRRETMSLTEAMDAALESVSTSAEQRQITLERRILSQNPVVVGDSARLQQVMTNLLTNAIRHTKAGGTIYIEVTEQDDWLELNVGDDGDGIAENRLPHVFDMFVQFGRQGHQNGGGLGVGLALVRSIVELHGGSVAAHSDGEGRGARFTVRLPRGHARLQQRAAEAPTTPRARRIVLVEDQADTREMLKLLLEEQGHRVAEAADGRDGIEVIRRERPDVALVDLGLPTLSGFDLAREIRRHDSLRDVFLVALSGYASESDIGSARAAGFDTHLTKPADVDRLNRLLDRLQPD